MIKRTLVLAATTFLCLGLSAQMRKAGKVEFGVKGGLNLATASTHYKSNEDRLAYNAGINFTYYLDDIYTINTGLEYTAKGVTGRNAFTYPITIEDGVFNPGGRVKTRIEMDYIQLPLTFGYEFVQKKNFALDMRVGLYVAYGINLKVKENFKGKIVYDNGTTIDIDYTTKNTNWDWQDMRRLDSGAAFAIGMKVNRVYITANYDLGLLNLGNSRPNDGRFKYRLKNRNFSFNLGYNFITKK